MEHNFSSGSRRDFFRKLALPAAGAWLCLKGCGRGQSTPGASSAANKRPAAPLPFDLVTVRGGEPEAMVTAALAALGGMKAFVKPGETVLLKPNVGFNRVPEQAANTNPDVVRALARAALEAGAKRVIVYDNCLYESRHCFSRSGIADAVQGLGAELEYTEERKFVDCDIKGKWLGKWPVYRDVLEADRVINIPVAKQHGTSGLSLGMKNLMGAIGGKREALHQDIHVALADLSAFLKPTLTVLDAYRILLRNGPQGGSLDDVSLTRALAVGVDPVAVDAFGCSLFGIDPATLGFLTEGQARGLGSIAPPAQRRKDISLGA